MLYPSKVGTIAILPELKIKPVLALSQVPALKGPLVFFDPSYVCPVYSSSNSGIFNQAQLWHEPLHGFYGDDDGTIESDFGITGDAQQEGSIAITYYIEGWVFGISNPSICGN